MQVYEKREHIPPEFASRLEEANIFYTIEYERFENNRGHTCLYACDERGILLIAVWKKLFFRWGNMPSEPFYFKEDVCERDFLDEVMQAVSKKVFWISQTDACACFMSYPSESKRIPFGNYIVDLTQDETVLFGNVTSKCRNMIRKAKKDGVIVICGGIELLDDYAAAECETWERSGASRNHKSVLLNYLETMDGFAKIYLAKKDGQVQGGAVFIYNQAMSYYMYGATVSRPSPGAMNLLQWKAMMDFKLQGIKYHSFVGCRIKEDPDSKYHGIQKFKSSFGGTLIQGYMFKYTPNMFLYRLFLTALRIRHPFQKSKGDIIDQEIHKWKDMNK